jgi:hypothetical protein
MLEQKAAAQTQNLYQYDSMTGPFYYTTTL